MKKFQLVVEADRSITLICDQGRILGLTPDEAGAVKQTCERIYDAAYNQALLDIERTSKSLAKEVY